MAESGGDILRPREQKTVYSSHINAAAPWPIWPTSARWSFGVDLFFVDSARSSRHLHELDRGIKAFTGENGGSIDQLTTRLTV